MTTARVMQNRATDVIRAAGCDTPEDDARELVAFVLGMSAAELSQDGATRVSERKQREIEALTRRRASHEPLAYIRRRARFRGIDFTVDSRVLIPRRETELLVDEAGGLSEGARVHEVGTGSGAVALATLSERPDLRVTASDISPDAVAVAQANAASLGIALDVTVADGLPDSLEKADLVVANLPYITEASVAERSPEIREEPEVAVFDACGHDGLGMIRRLIDETPSGWRLALEHDTHHGAEVRSLLRAARTRKDYRGDERVTIGFAP